MYNVDYVTDPFLFLENRELKFKFKFSYQEQYVFFTQVN